MREIVVTVVVVAGVVRRMAKRAEESNRGRGWPLLVGVLWTLGAVAGYFASGIGSMLFGEADEEMIGVYALFGSLIGGAVVAAPAYLAFEASSRRNEENTGPITEDSGRTWWWLAAVVSAPLSVVVLTAPFLVAGTASESVVVGWVTDSSELPEGISAAAVEDYILTGDTYGTVLVAPDVTLDCGDHSITGERVGVLLSEGSTLRGCVVVGARVAVGVSGQGVAIEDLKVRGSDVGVMVASDSELDCRGATIQGIGSAHGVGISAQDGAMLSNCQVSGFNTAVGLGGSRNVVVTGVSATANRIGFYLVNGTSGTQISASTANGNEIGFLFEQSVSDVTIEGNTAANNRGSGFQVGYTKGSRFVGNAVQGGGSGFWLTNSDDNRFEGNTVTGAAQWFSIGLERSSSGNLFIGNEVSSGGVGIAVFGGARNNQFVENILHHNSKGAHTEAATGGNTFTANVVRSNSHVGLWDDTVAAADRYTGNECSENGDADSVPDGLC